MATPEIISKYTDPAYQDFKNSVNALSDDYPIAMLPVRLETKYVNESRIVVTRVPGQSQLNSVISKTYGLIQKLKIWDGRRRKTNNAKAKKQLKNYNKSAQLILRYIGQIPKISGDDKRILRDAATDLHVQVNSLPSAGVAAELRALKNSANAIINAANNVSLNEESIYEKGYTYYNELEKVGDRIEELYVSQKASSQNVDAKLDAIQGSLGLMQRLISEADFRATEGTIQKIQSKISHIKRMQKNSFVRLRDYRFGYSGSRNLQDEEYALRRDINALKLKIDQEHAPYMHLLESLKRYPVRRLIYRIEKAYAHLRAANVVGVPTYQDVMAAKEELYDALRAIRERAHRPLDGQVADIDRLKNKYASLESEIKKFLRKANKIKPKDRYQKAALTRMETHLTDEYLADLEELLPGNKTIEQQTLSDSTVRITSASSFITEKNISSSRDVIKNIGQSGEAGLQAINQELDKLKNQLAVSTTNTTLLSRSMQSTILGKVQSLKSHVTNYVNANNIHSENSILKSTEQKIEGIENLVHDQQTDAFDKRDRFYDAYRKKIKFVLKTETVRELWVRIFPDDIAVDNHDERLSPQEIEIGKTYYQQVCNNLVEDQKGAEFPAYRAAAVSLGVRRAAFVINALRPTNFDPTNFARQNGLLPIIADLKKQLSLRKVDLQNHKKLWENPSFENFLAGLMGNLQNGLAATNFTFCVENRASIDEFLKLTQAATERLQKEFFGTKQAATKQIIETQIGVLTQAYEFVYGILKNNIIAFSETYVPVIPFPQVQEKSKSWDRAGISQVLPDRFVVVTKRGQSVEHIVLGNQVQSPLQLSIDPSSDQANRFQHLPNGDLEVPEELRWMFDFDAAVDAGMAVRVPLQESDFLTKFDLVMAYGVKESTAQQGQEMLNNLFANHIYSDGGMEYLHVGTPTNNTDENKTPYNALDNDFEGAFNLFFNEADNPVYKTKTSNNEIEIQDGQFFKDAFGLPENIAECIRYYEKEDIVKGRAMNRALYNATLKYYMHIMVDNLLTENDKDKTVEFLMNYVSAVGTVPSFRIDNQPYGVLPITNYRSFKATGNVSKGTEGSFVKTLSIFLNATRHAFDAFDKKPQTVNGEAYENDPQATFLKILGLEPFSKEFYYRFGTNISSRWDTSNDDNLDFAINWDGGEQPFAPKQVATYYDYLLKEMGHSNAISRENAIKKSNAYVNRYMHANFILGDLVQDAKVANEYLAEVTPHENYQGNFTSGNYIDYLLSNTSSNFLEEINVNEIPTVEVEGEAKLQNTLLFTMLRGGLIYDNSSFATNAINKIKDLPVAELERLLSNHIDLCSYRLDAWLGALADYRLNELRKSNSEGTYIGAFGFVENLLPEPTPAKATHLPQGLEPANGKDVTMQPGNLGFVHGPSMNHAVTAAVLRAGYKSLKNKGNNGNALAINLTSARVRKALHLLEGVGQGQESGALLGYMFERALHEKYTDGNNTHLEMDTYIYRLRRKFPTFGDLPKDSDIDLSQEESIKAANVVDGLAMIDHFEEELKNSGDWDDDKTFVDMIIDESGNEISFNGYPWNFDNEVPDPANPPQGSTTDLENLKLKAIVHELDNMADAFDALSDLMNAEGVYQLVRGNHVRASAVLNALAEGRVPLDPEIINSMRQGVIVSHRVSLNLVVQPPATNPWPSIALSQKSLAEPSLNFWLASQIGDPSKIDWQANYGQTQTFIQLEDLKMQAIDLVLLITTGGDEGMEEIQLRCLDYLYQNGATENDEIELKFNTCSPAADFSLGEIISLLQHLGKMMASARMLDARDFRVAESDDNFGIHAPNINTVNMFDRLVAITARYQALYDSLAVFTPEKVGYSDAERLLAIDKLKELNQWNFNGFYPNQAEKDDAMTMAAKLISAKTVMESNLNFVNGKIAVLELEPDQGTWVGAIKEIAAKLFGKGMQILPEFACTNSIDLQQQMALPHQEGVMRHHPENYVQEWMGTSAMVRDRLAHAETAFALREVLHENAPQAKVAQLPFDASMPVQQRDYWLGAAYPDSFAPNDDRLSLVMLHPENVSAQTCGLMLDEWMEIIPDKKETTGIAFHFNQPDARAPQTLLLAVPPEKTGNWNVDDVTSIVEEAYNMAKLRAVEPEQIDFSMFSQLLPATATLAFDKDEMVRRLGGAAFSDNFDETEQLLGRYIDYTTVNHGFEPDLEDQE